MAQASCGRVAGKVKLFVMTQCIRYWAAHLARSDVMDAERIVDPVEVFIRDVELGMKWHWHSRLRNRCCVAIGKRHQNE